MKRIQSNIEIFPRFNNSTTCRAQKIYFLNYNIGICQLHLNFKVVFCCGGANFAVLQFQISAGGGDTKNVCNFCNSFQEPNLLVFCQYFHQQTCNTSCRKKTSGIIHTIDGRISKNVEILNGTNFLVDFFNIFVLFICKTKSRLRRRHCGLARHFKTDPTESVALCFGYAKTLF
jgi:hypothetical protein